MVTTLNTGVVLKELLGTFEPTSSIASLCSCKSRLLSTYLHGYSWILLDIKHIAVCLPKVVHTTDHICAHKPIIFKLGDRSRGKKCCCHSNGSTFMGRVYLQTGHTCSSSEQRVTMVTHQSTQCSVSEVHCEAQFYIVLLP